MSDISDTDAIFSRAYACALKDKFQIDIGKHDCIFTSPSTLRGIATGDLIYPQMTNYLIYDCADALLCSDTPNYTLSYGIDGSYTKQLRSYIDWGGDPSQVNLNLMNKARDASTAANNQYFKVLEQAKAEWFLVKDKFPNFWQWTTSHKHHGLSATAKSRRAAVKELNETMDLYYGPDTAILSNCIDNLAKAQSSNRFPCYNMDGLFDDPDLIENAIKYANSGEKAPEGPIEQSTIRVPAYSIPYYTDQVQHWINLARQGATRDHVITIDANQGLFTRWEDYGFKDVDGGASVFWPFFSGDVCVNGEWESHKLNTEGRENDISLELAMIGTSKFDVQPGQWDIPNVKELFPNRLPHAPDVLSSKHCRIVTVLVGYDVELQVKFGANLRDEVNQIYEEVKTAKGFMSIFGFHVSAGDHGGHPDRVETKFSDVKWDHASGSMNLTPTKGQVYPTILGVVARRFD